MLLGDRAKRYWKGSGLETKKPIIQVAELVGLVKERRCLWDRDDERYRDKAQRDKCWNEIYKEFEPDYDVFGPELKSLIAQQVSKKWYNVRDAYAKSRKTFNPRHKPYLHAKLLGFLDSIYYEDKDGNVLNRTNPDKSDEEQQEEEWISEVFIPENEELNSSTAAKKTKGHHFSEKEAGISSAEANESLINVIANMITQEEDDDRAFFKSLMPTVKSLSDDSKFEFRMQVMALLKKIRSKDKREKIRDVKIECLDSEEGD